MTFAIPPALIFPAVLALVFPVTLFLTTRLPRLKGKNALQFLLAALIQAGLWLCGSLFMPEPLSSSNPADWIPGALTIGSALLLWLEAWALLSRGYTLSMLLVLLRAAKPLAIEELARRYRNGVGLGWIMQHRLGGLRAAKLVRKEGEEVVLTPRRGFMVAAAYQVAITVFGLRRTG
jgi:hypothetical protein